MTETSLPTAGGSYTREPDGTLRRAAPDDGAALATTRVDDSIQPAAGVKKPNSKRPQSTHETEA